MKKPIKAEFGKIAILRAICPQCGTPALVIQGRMACCGAIPNRDENYIAKREVEGAQRRPNLGKRVKEIILKQQGRLCFYCQRPFGIPFWHPKRHKIAYTGIHFDHFVCWDFSRNSDIGNMVAACSICNSIKGAKIFANADDARAFIKHRIGQRQYEFIENESLMKGE
jgi:5-methylcytosine-specific restriction endonuclease McrA